MLTSSKSLKRLICVLMAFVLLATTFALPASAASYSTGKYTVSHSKGVNVRKGAGTSYSIQGAAAKGVSFDVTKVSGEWGYTKSIKTSSGNKAGWVSLNYCKRVNTKITFSSVSAPNGGSVVLGKGYHLSGKITSSSSNINYVRGQVFNSSSKQVMSKAVSVNTSSYNLRDSAIDSALTFGSLSAGSYTLKYTVKTKDGTSATKSLAFKVAKPSPAPTPKPSTSTSDTLNGTDKNIKSRIDMLSALLKGKYFTKSGSECSDSMGADCKNSNVITANWFKKIFGNVNVTQFPESYGYGEDWKGYSCTAWSCVGFAHFAEWYIFKTSNKSKVSVNNMGTYSFNAKNVKSHAKVGDIFRLDNRHSVIYISADSSGIRVLDCNFDSKCGVSEHKIYYSSYGKFTISRATNRG